MGELTPVPMQQCRALDITFYPVASSAGTKSYLVDLYRGTCECIGFRTRKKCKHLDEARTAVCSWHELYGEAQTEEQRRDMICPSCGDQTMWVQVGV